MMIEIDVTQYIIRHFVSKMLINIICSAEL